jgi:hypothetical protein
LIDQAIGIRAHAGGDEEDVRLERPSAIAGERDLQRLAGLLDFFGLGLEMNLDAAFLERSLERQRDVIVLDRQQLRQHLDEHDLGADGVIKIRELAPDCPRADDRHALG